MAITLFGSVSVPTDNGTNTTNPTAFANPPIASMVAGDLVFVYAYCRTSGATLAVSNAGGQTWTSGTSQSSGNATLSANFFWCRFNGTWSAAPSFSFGATTNNNVVMLVFRPTSGSNLWAVDPGKAGTFVDFAATTSILITAGYTPTNASTVSICAWNTDDDNTWGTFSGSGWSKTSLSAQFRNTSGNDSSSSFGYNIQTTATSISNVAQNEATNGADGGFTFIICFYEITGTNVNIPVGAVTIDGVAPTVAVTNNKNLSIPVGSIVISGVAPTVLTPRNLTVPVGAVTISGVAPSVAISDNKNLVIGIGTVVIAGVAPSVSVSDNKNLSIPVGIITIAGIAPSVAVTNNINLSIPVGVITIAGVAPTVLTPRNLNIPVGDIVITGVAPSVSVSDNKNLTVPVGDVIISGISPSVAVTNNINLTVPVGDIIIAGVAPTLSISDNKNLIISVGDVVIEGVAPTVTATDNKNVNIPVGLITIEGIAPTLSISNHINLTIPAGEVIVSGVAPAIGSNINLQPGTGQIVLQGIVPTVTVSNHQNFNIPSGDISIQGIAPTVQTPVNLNIPAGQIVITGITPLVGGSAMLEIDTGEIFISGIAPSVTIAEVEIIVVDQTVWIKFGKFNIMPCDPCAPKFIVSCLTDEPTDDFEFNIYGLSDGLYYWRITEASTILTKAFNHVEGTPLSISVADVPEGFFTTKRTFLFEILKTASSENPIPFLIGQYVEQLSIDIECNIYPSNTVGEDTTP